MKLHQLRVGAVFNCAERGPFHSDSNALTAWSDWIERTDKRDLETFLADVVEAQNRYDERAEESRYWDEIEASQWDEHVNSERATYYTRSNLL